MSNEKSELQKSNQSQLQKDKTKKTQNIEILVSPELDTFPSIQQFQDKTKSSQNLLYPTPMSSLQMTSQNLNQNMY